MDKIRQKNMIAGLSTSHKTIAGTPAAGEAERLAEQLEKMIVLIKNFQAEIEHNANHVSCRMHDFRSFLLTNTDGHGINKEAIFIRASECVNTTLGELIVLKEEFKNNISQLTLHEEDAARLFQLFQALEQTYSELTTDMQAKLRLLNATLCH